MMKLDRTAKNSAMLRTTGPVGASGVVINDKTVRMEKKNFYPCG